jgi:hypothetical protein
MPPPVVAQVSSAPSAYPVATSIAGTLSMVKGYITKSAEQAPESLYAYKATPDVRSLGQLFGHVANANFGICSAIAGEKSPATADFEKSATTKVDLTKALADSYAYCEKERWRTPPGRGGPGTRRQGHHELNGGYATLPRGRRRNLW